MNSNNEIRIADSAALKHRKNRLPSFVLQLIVLTSGLLFFSSLNDAYGQDSLTPHVQQMPDTAWSDSLPLLGMQAIIVTWVFVLGACFGSFLNVVIYRMPAGMSLGKPKSRCPKCETQLAARDNIPVFGWLMLRGKCRYCGLPIPVRYPLIEATCGAVFLLLLFGELLTGATNLPLRHPDHFHVNPGSWLVWFAKWDLLGIYLFHCCLLIIVLATVMIGYDGHPAQRKLNVFGLLVAVLAGSMWSELRPVAAYSWSDSVQQVAWTYEWTDPLLNPGSRYQTGVSLVGFLDGTIGAAAGLLAGLLVRWQMNKRRKSAMADQGIAVSPNDDPAVSSFAALLLMVGAFLGWQACGTFTLMTLPALAFVKIFISRQTAPWLFRASGPGLFVLLCAFIFCWRQLNDAAWMIGVHGWDFTELGWRGDWMLTLVVMYVFSSLVRFCNKSEKHHEVREDSVTDVS